MKMSDESAIEIAVEITKIICANPETKLYPSASQADDIAEFIDVLSDKLAGNGMPEEN